MEYPCALIDWYGCISNTPDEDMDMWIVKPVQGHSTIIHLDMILWCAHLIPVFGLHYLDRSLKLTFSNYYVNKYVDHHMHEIVF